MKADAQTVIALVRDLQKDWPAPLIEIRVYDPQVEKPEWANLVTHHPGPWARVFSPVAESENSIAYDSVGMIYAECWWWAGTYGGRFDRAPGREIAHIQPYFGNRRLPWNSTKKSVAQRRPYSSWCARAFDDYDTMADTLITLAEHAPAPDEENPKHLKARLLR